jgi:deoxyribose-phosphate aldolase
MDNIAAYLDLANHHPNSTEADIKILCEKVAKYGFNSAFVNPHHVVLAKSYGIKVGTVVSFPLGQELLRIKIDSCLEAIAADADELDVSLNVGYLKEHAWEKSLDEMVKIVTAVKNNKNAIVKFIPETGFLTPEEIKKSAELIAESGADFFKTCSGLGPRGATIEDVKLVREAIGDKLKIKVAGGVETYEQAVAFIEAGADRIGTSHAVEIIERSSSSSTHPGE